MLKDKSFIVTFFVFALACLFALLSLVFPAFGIGKDIAFYSFAAICFITAIAVVSLRNIVYSGFLLVLMFVSVAGIYITLNADFIAAAQILINGTAVTIMMIFGIWLTHSKEDTANENYSWVYRYTAFIFGLGLLIMLVRLSGIYFSARPPFFTFNDPAWLTTKPQFVDTAMVIGKAFFNEYLIPFEVASIVLLMALIGAIVMAMREKNKNTVADININLAKSEEV